MSWFNKKLKQPIILMLSYEDNGAYVVDYKIGDNAYKPFKEYSSKQEAMAAMEKLKQKYIAKGHDVSIDDVYENLRSLDESVDRIRTLAGIKRIK